MQDQFGLRAYHVHTNEAGEEVRVPMMPTHVPEAVIPDDHRTNMINGAGVTVFLIGIAGLVNYGTEFAAKFVNNEQAYGQPVFSDCSWVCDGCWVCYRREGGREKRSCRADA